MTETGGVKLLRNVAIFCFILAMGLLLIGGYFAANRVAPIPDSIVIVLGAMPLFYFLLRTYPHLRAAEEQPTPEEIRGNRDTQTRDMKGRP